MRRIYPAGAREHPLRWSRGESVDGLRRIRVGFPDAVVTHSPVQVLHIDGDGVIRRHDYTARAFGRWARAVQVLDSYRWFGGIRVATRRTVTPRLPGGRRALRPTLVHIAVQDVSVDS